MPLPDLDISVGEQVATREDVRLVLYPSALIGMAIEFRLPTAIASHHLHDLQTQQPLATVDASSMALVAFVFLVALIRRLCRER